MVFSTEYKSLTEKFNLSLDQLDYKYIENCKSVKQLERILRVLRSGDEGIFPNLIKFCEAKLRDKDPSNRLLHLAKNITRYSDLPEEEKIEILTDIENWSSEFPRHEPETTPMEGSKTVTSNKLPPVRMQNISVKQNENNVEGILEENGVKQKTCKPRSYEEWDKYNVSDELKRLEDEGEDVKKQKREIRNGLQLSRSISVTGLTQTECQHIANLERIKGNEAFKAQDYEEACIYYKRSLSAFKTAKTLTNRAQTYIKLQNYIAAVIDSNEAISLEPNNVKALYRRGIAHKEAKMYDLATMDFTIVLELEPENKLAKDQLQEVEHLKSQETHGRQKAVIEEIETDTQTEESNLEKQLNIDRDGISRRLAIEDVTDVTTRPFLDEMCNFGGDQINALSKETKEMLNVFRNQETAPAKSTCKMDKENKNHNKCQNKNYKSRKVVQPMVSETSSIKHSEPECEFVDIEIQGDIPKENHAENVLELSVCGCANHEKYFTQDKLNETNFKPTETQKNEFADKKRSYQSKETGLLEEHLKENKTKPEECKDKSNEQTILTQNEMTPFEFIHVWLSKNANFNSYVGASCLLAVKPDQLPQILTNKLDGPLLNGLLMGIGEIVRMGKTVESLDYLNHLTKVPRIKTVSLFLSDEEKKDIQALLTLMENTHGIYLHKVREVLMIQ